MDKLGLSGDTISMENGIVVKTCETNQKRFLSNIAKQKAFSNPYISAVPITEEGVIDGKNYIKMQRLTCDNSMIWISKVGSDAINEFIYTIEKYFAFIIANSILDNFDYDTWQMKITELESKITDDDILTILNHIKHIHFDNKFYYGAHHGDFTLTNLLISTNSDSISIDAIDFLDTFINSPIHDFVKLRQDTSHLWTINLTKNFTKIDTNRVVILLNYIDVAINDMIMGDQSLQEYYLPFQILNLIRIIPYNKDVAIFSYLKREVKGLFNALDTNIALRGPK